MVPSMLAVAPDEQVGVGVGRRDRLGRDELAVDRDGAGEPAERRAREVCQRSPLTAAWQCTRAQRLVVRSRPVPPMSWSLASTVRSRYDAGCGGCTTTLPRPWRAGSSRLMAHDLDAAAVPAVRYQPASQMPGGTGASRWTACPAASAPDDASSRAAPTPDPPIASSCSASPLVRADRRAPAPLPRSRSASLPRAATTSSPRSSTGPRRPPVRSPSPSGDPAQPDRPGPRSAARASTLRCSRRGRRAVRRAPPPCRRGSASTPRAGWPPPRRARRGRSGRSARSSTASRQPRHACSGSSLGASNATRCTGSPVDSRASSSDRAAPATKPSSTSWRRSRAGRRWRRPLHGRRHTTIRSIGLGVGGREREGEVGGHRRAGEPERLEQVRRAAVADRQRHPGERRPHPEPPGAGGQRSGAQSDPGNRLRAAAGRRPPASSGGRG